MPVLRQRFIPHSQFTIRHSLFSNWRRCLMLALLLWAFGALMFNARAQSPTMDEQNHIARGYTLLRTGDPRLSVEHPPLINALEALPLFMLSPLRLPVDDWAWDVGEWYRFADLFLWQMGNPVEVIVFLARLPVVALTVLLAALAFRWARGLWGCAGGLFALALVAFDPNILAHGSLATTDLGQTTTVFIAGYAVWRMAQQPSWGGYVLTGLAMGAMLASKLSALLFFGVFITLLCGLNSVPKGLRSLSAAASAPRDARLPLMHRLGGIALLVLLAMTVLWAAYAFQCSPAVQRGAAVPLGTYWRGVRSIFVQAQGGRPSYLLGETSVHGWYAYFPIAFAVKTPLATLVALLLAVLSMLARKAWRADIFLLAPVLAYWGVAVQSALNLGYRHLLPILPFLYVWAAQLLGLAELASHTSVPAILAPLWHKCVKIVRERHWLLLGFRAFNLKALLSLWLALTCVGIAPHFLAYFNALGGGPANGWRIVADSNIDWGQDLKRLRDYLAEHELGGVRLSWFGSSYPEFYGIDYDPLPGLPHHFDLWAAPPFDMQQPEPGIYVISVSNLVEIPFEDKRVFAYFRQREPDARVGYSIYVYKVPP